MCQYKKSLSRYNLIAGNDLQSRWVHTSSVEYAADADMRRGSRQLGATLREDL